jgi:hypothetical protein
MMFHTTMSASTVTLHPEPDEVEVISSLLAGCAAGSLLTVEPVKATCAVVVSMLAPSGTGLIYAHADGQPSCIVLM